MEKRKRTLLNIAVAVGAAVLCAVLIAVFFNVWNDTTDGPSDNATLYYEYNKPIAVNIDYNADTLNAQDNSVKLCFAGGEKLAFIGKNCDLELYCYIWNSDKQRRVRDFPGIRMTGGQVDVEWSIDQIGGVVFSADNGKPLYFKADFPCGLDDGYVYAFDLSGMNGFVPTGAPKSLF